MKLTLKRTYKAPDYTIGHLYIDGQYFCDTLEDTVRDLTREKKIPGQTAIPAGTYHVLVTYSPKFKRKLPILVNVPMFTGIRIHRGNTAKDTEGCILVGKNTEKGKVTGSTDYEIELTRRLSEAEERDETNTIEICTQNEH